MADEKKPCGCYDEPMVGRSFSLFDAKPMPERAEFTDNCHYIRHYCVEHWEKRNGQ